MSYKTKLCRKYLVGTCPNSTRTCRFFHPDLNEACTRSGMFKSLAYKTIPCKNFGKNGETCPKGDACDFVHDVEWNSLYHNLVSGGGGRKTRHCWAYVQGECKFLDCPYVHPRNPEPYKKFTPCLQWPNCWRLKCPLRHPELNPRLGNSWQPAVELEDVYETIQNTATTKAPPGPHLYSSSRDIMHNNTYDRGVAPQSHSIFDYTWLPTIPPLENQWDGNYGVDSFDSDTRAFQMGYTGSISSEEKKGRLHPEYGLDISEPLKPDFPYTERTATKPVNGKGKSHHRRVSSGFNPGTLAAIGDGREVASSRHKRNSSMVCVSVLGSDRRMKI